MKAGATLPQAQELLQAGVTPKAAAEALTGPERADRDS